SIKHVHVVARAVGDPAEQLEFIGAVMDVTATKRAEDELRKTQTELAHVTRVTMLGELTASIAHEVNQPLAAAIANAEACLRWLDRETPDIAKARRSVEWVVNDNCRASDVIQRVRALANKADIEKVPLDINTIVREVIVLMQHELIRHGVSLRTELAMATSLVLGDRVQLQQDPITENQGRSHCQLRSQRYAMPNQLVLHQYDDFPDDSVDVERHLFNVGLVRERSDPLDHVAGPAAVVDDPFHRA